MSQSEETASDFDEQQDEQQAKQQRRYEIQNDACDIYRVKSLTEAQQCLRAFVEKWQPLEPKVVKIFQKDIELTFTFYSGRYLPTRSKLGRHSCFRGGKRINQAHH